MPRRKILLSTGGNNYRPPLERSKSAPKLFAIEEIVGEEDEEEDCDEATRARKQDEKKKLDEVKPCCKEDYLYPSITLGRRRCRRGHSIRKSRLLRGSILTQKSYPPTKAFSALPESNLVDETKDEVVDDTCISLTSEYSVSSIPNLPAPRKSLGSDEDFESFLLYNNYDSKEPLAGDLMSYFDLQLQTPTSSMITTSTTMSMSDLLDDEMLLKNQRTSMSMVDLIDYQSDNELEDGDLEPPNDIYFNQDALLATLRRQSKATESETVQHQPFIHHSNNQADASGAANGQTRSEFIFKRPVFEDDQSSETPSSLCMSEKTICVNLDSDEGSISSGCETSSTMTANAEEKYLPRRGSVLDRVRSFEQLAESQVVRDPIGERGSSGKFYSRNVTFPNGVSSGCKSGSFIIASPESEISRSGTLTRMETGIVTRTVQLKHDDDSDELSDESGYVEFQDLSLKSVFA
jgi:Phosphotyrosine interaction domain (PTB/PID)